MSLRNVVTMVMIGGLALSPAAPTEAGGLVAKGVKAGVAVSDIGGGVGDLVRAQTRGGFTGGAFVSIGLGGAFQLQPELLFVSKGATSHLELTDDSGILIGTAKETFALDYLEIPVLARIAFPTHGPVRPSLLAGLAYAIKLRGRHSVGIPGVPSADLEFVSRADLGLVLGAAVDLHRGPRGFLLDARYTLGLTNVWGTLGNLNARNRTFALMAGYGI